MCSLYYIVILRTLDVIVTSWNCMFELKNAEQEINYETLSIPSPFSKSK